MQHADEIPAAFRAHFARHNRQVLALTIFTLFAAILLWTVSYMAVYWLALLAVTTARGIDAQPPAVFPPIFILCAFGLCVLAWVIHKIRPDYFPRDRKSSFGIFMDFLLAAPRVTLAVWGNLSAWISLNEAELAGAWELLQAIAHTRKFGIQSLPLEIPDRRLRARAVFALQLAGLVELRRNEEEGWLVLQGDKARRLARETVKIDAREGE